MDGVRLEEDMVKRGRTGNDEIRTFALDVDFNVC